jgi:hypothetical protein
MLYTDRPKEDIMEKLTSADKSRAYHRITRELRNMHHTERNILDTYPHYEQIMRLIHEGRDAEALALAEPIRTEQGDAWRARKAAL